MSLVKRVGLVFIGLLGCAAPAMAQSQITSPALPTGDPRVDAKHHAGAVYYTPTFSLKELGVDTNVFNSATDPKKDFTATLSPRIDAWLPLQRRARITTALSTDLVYFKTFASERSVDPDFLIRGDLYIRKLTLFVEDSLLSSRQRPSFEIDARSRRNENAARGGINITLSPKTSLELAVNRSTHRYDQDTLFFGTNLAEALNRTSDGYGATLRKKLTPKTTFELAASAGKDRFEFSGQKNADRVRIVPALVFSARALISGTFRVGFQRFSTLSDEVPDQSGLVASTDLSYTLHGDNKLGFKWSRDIDYSFTSDQPFYVSTGLGGRLQRRLSSRIDAIASLDRYKYAYQSATISGTVLAADRVDTTRNFTIDLGYRLGRDTRVGFAVSRWNRSSTSAAGRDYSGWRIGAGATYGR
jgi:hypothetical protein